MRKTGLLTILLLVSFFIAAQPLQWKGLPRLALITNPAIASTSLEISGQSDFFFSGNK